MHGRIAKSSNPELRQRVGETAAPVTIADMDAAELHSARATTRWSGVDWNGIDFDDLDVTIQTASAGAATRTPPAAVPHPRTGADPTETATGRDGLSADPELRAQQIRKDRRARARARRKLRRGLCTTPVKKTVLLIDLENVCSGSRDQDKVVNNLRQIVQTAGPVDEVLAIASHTILTRQRPLLKRAGIPSRAVKPGPNSADEALVAAAKRYAAMGTRTFIVASADHFFARIAKLGELRVVVTPGHPVSSKLAAAATQVTCISGQRLPAGGGLPAGTALAA